MNENDKVTEFRSLKFGIHERLFTLVEYENGNPPELFSGRPEESNLGILWVYEEGDGFMIATEDGNIPFAAFYAFTMAVAEWKKGQS